MTRILKASLFAALLASTGLVSSLHAQTTTGTPATGTTPSVTPMTPAPGTMTAPTMGTPPAATTMGTTTDTHRPANRGAHTNSAAPAAVTTTTAPSRTAAAPVAGANSFTEGEARRRITAKGFGQVTDLKKDDKGVWRGMTTKDGKSMGVALDYQGNVVSQ